MLRDKDKERKAFQQSIANGRAVAEARRNGFEMVDAERLNNLLDDLEAENLIIIEAQRGDPNPGERGIEILRG